jgi:hypothetical protein
VRRWGGVLEHPAYSDAWAAHDLLSPPTGGHWVNADWQGGWTCYVEQGRYEHPAKKATWLYAVGAELPSLRWGHVPDRDVSATVSWCGNRTKKWGAHHWRARGRIQKQQASATPPAFRDMLLNMARSVSEHRKTG